MSLYNNAIFVHTKDQMPKGAHWAIIKFGRIHIPGDERSRTHPGHGYPERDEPNLTYQAYLDEEDWKTAVTELIGEKSGTSWTAMRVNPATAKIKVEIVDEPPTKPEPKPQKKQKCIYVKPWIGSCNATTHEGSFCPEHLGEKCRCGAQATRGCDNAGSLVCGMPLCSKCYCNH